MIFAPGGRQKTRRPSLIFIALLAITLLGVLSSAQETTTNEKTDPATTTTDGGTTATTDPATTSTKDTASDTTTASFETTTDSKSTSTESATSATSSDYPVVTVPPTADAPYMQTSDTPEGTVFIAVGAILGLFGFAILAWRGMVAWSVNRSVRQAALQHSSETKGLLRSKKKRSTVQSNSLSLGRIGTKNHSSHGRGHGHGHGSTGRRSQKVAGPNNSGLFFSPTAGMHNSNKRGSTYLPAGYYAAGSATAGGGRPHFSSSDLPGMGPQAQGYTRTQSGPSPPGTPTHQYPPPPPPHDFQPGSAGRHSYVGGSTSTVNLAASNQGRTPSAYLEDLFDSHSPQNNSNSGKNRYRG